MGEFKTRIDLTGQKFGWLTVIKYAYTKKKAAYWLCKCDCGNETIITANSILSNKTKSCGCLRKDLLTKHSYSNSNLYTTWANMKQRCYNPKTPEYKYYGERNIKVCKNWLESFTNFYEWAISNGYKEDLSIDRINVNGNYEPSNCRWATPKQQARNTRYNKIITYNNETHNLSEWAEIVGINPITLGTRLRRNWTIERALTTKVGE